ncbi:hypothetical protein EC991_008435 [Linnemannia zychae]|nr:hypothetical protein EC991_008435 [Linnemannia zychae]
MVNDHPGSHPENVVSLSLSQHLSPLPWRSTSWSQLSLDKRSKPQQSEPVGCGKSLCLFQCASSIAHQTPPGILNYNTCCSSIRLIRNINAFGAIVGVVIVLNIIALFIPFSSSAGEGRVYISTSLAIAAHVLTFLFWLGFIVGASRAVTSFRAQLKLAYLDALLAVLLLVWNVFNASESLDNYCRGGFCTFWVGYAFWGTLFSITALTVDVLTIIFCKRQLRTTSTETYPLEAMQKYELPSQQPGRSPDTVVDLANSNVANYPLSDGKIEA